MSSSSNDEPSYTILQINRDATKQEIRKAYQRLAMLRRPDKNMGDFANACAAFNKLKTAFSVLSDPISRAKYDKKLEQPVSSYRETKATTKSSSLRSDFSSDDETTSAPAGSPRRRRSESSYFKTSGSTYYQQRQRDKDDQNAGEWCSYQSARVLDDLIRDGMSKVKEYLKETKSLMADDDDYSHAEWVDIKVMLDVEMRLLDRMRKDRYAM